MGRFMTSLGFLLLCMEGKRSLSCDVECITGIGGVGGGGGPKRNLTTSSGVGIASGLLRATTLKSC